MLSALYLSFKRSKIKRVYEQIVITKHRRKKMTKFEEFEEVIARLRAPDGCPWDRA